MPTTGAPGQPEPSMFDMLLEANDAVVKFAVSAYNNYHSLNITNPDVEKNIRSLQKIVAPHRTVVHLTKRLNQVSYRAVDHDMLTDSIIKPKSTASANVVV